MITPDSDTGASNLTLTHWGAYEIQASDGAIQAVRPFRHDPDPSPIGSSLVDIGRCRVGMPSVRQSWLEAGPGAATNRRGGERFVEVGWDHALDLVAGELDRVRSEYGNQAIYAGSYGWASAGRFHHAQSQLHRFMNSIGGYTGSVNTYSLAAAEVILPHVVGSRWWALEKVHTSWDVIAAETDLMVSFGGIPLKNSQVDYGGVGRHEVSGWLRRCAERGARFVNVSPIDDDVVDYVDPEWLPIRPGTDVALMLALIHTLIENDSYDRDFVGRYCVGWEALAAYITGDTDGIPKSPEWAGPITTIPPEPIRSLAGALVTGRTMINASWSLQRAHHGEHAIWAVIALAAAIGQIGMPGGGFGIGYGAVAALGNGFGKGWLPRFKPGRPVIDSFIPVARIADLLTGSGEEYEYNGATRTYPDIHLVYWAGGNPFHHHQDLNRLRQAWQQPETVIVHEPFWTATAKHADIVLPTTTALERNDIGGKPTDPFFFAMRRVIEPVGGARNDHDIFADLARRLGVGDAFSEGRTADQWVRSLYEDYRRSEPGNPSFEEFWQAGFIDRGLGGGDPKRVMLEDFREDPERHPLPTPSGRIELHSERIAGFGYADCPPHPAWMPPHEWLGDADDAELHLISNQPSTRLHSQLDHGSNSRREKVAGLERLRMHPADAARLGIEDGDAVRVYNDRGACLAGVEITDRIRRRVVQMATGAWYAPGAGHDLQGTCLHGNANLLTADIGTSSLAQGPSAQTCLVRVELWPGAPPAHHAFDPPEIVTLGER